MKVIQESVITVSKKKYVQCHLHSIRYILSYDISDSEIDVISEFVSLEQKYIEDGYINSVTRKIVCENLGLSSSSLSGFIKTLTNKGYIVKKEFTNKLILDENFVPDMPEQGYQFKLKLNLIKDYKEGDENQ